MIISIIGLGHIGGSFALGIKAVESGHTLLGYDINQSHCDQALSLGIVDRIETYEDCLQQADLVVLATPVSVIKAQLPEALGAIKDEAIIIDLGSTKKTFCNLVRKHPKRGRYVSCHPIAGTENSGPEAAFASLFKYKMVIICDRNDSDHDALDMVVGFFKKLEMHLSYMDAGDHDRHIAYVSHLSHITSFALGLTVLDKEKDEKSIFTMAGSGFSSTVRLAKSSPEMWAPIFSQNKENIIEALEAYIKQLMFFKQVLLDGNEEKSLKLMEKANDIRRILSGIDR